MSASLVGSEMCIRDRLRAVARCCTLLHVAARCCSLLRAAARCCPSLHAACLLYTSDAADDM
eukprot:6871252-Alexandrium_andersonii.AAC.1